MGCSASKLDDEEAVQLCKDRRNFIKQAVEQRMRFASGHIAYIQSLRRVSIALRSYVDGDEHHDFLDSYTTPPFTPVKRLSPEIIGIHLKSFTPPTNQSEKITSHAVKYLRSGVEPSVTFEEWPGSPETVRIDYPTDHYGIDGFFTMQASPMHSSFHSSPYNRPSFPPPSPQTSQWDFFWNPFSSLDAYGYHPRDSLDRMTNDDEIARLRQVREEEGIPELEEEEQEEDDEEEDDEKLGKVQMKDETSKVDTKPTRVAVDSEGPAEVNRETETVHSIKEVQSHGGESIEVSETQNAVDLEVTNEGEVAVNREGTEETPGFTVYVNRRPTSMTEVMKDVSYQFMKICDTAHEVSVMLEVSRAQHSSTSSELAAIRMLNPVALFRSASSSRSSSSRFLQASSSSRDDGYESSSDYSEESCMISGSHQSTLDRLYAWEKKLYEEVKAGERIRIAYEKKCTQLRNHDVNGEEPSVVDRTRAAVRDLRTRLQVSIHSVEYVSKRIETLRDEELHPQLMELIHGLARMWRTMADCHRIQKGTIDEAKLLLFTPSAAAAAAAQKNLEATPPKPIRHATNLEAELRHWRSCLENWIDAQRSYARALAGWALRCARPQHDGGGRPARSPLSPGRSYGGGGAPPVFGVCVQWSRLLDSVSEARAVEGVDFFAAGIGSVCAQQREGDAAAEGAMTVERVAEVASRVLCAGLSVSVGSLADFAVGSAEGYEALMTKCGEGGMEERVET